jgi:hypothetical protein
MDSEFNKSPAETNRLDWPCAVTSCIKKAGEEARFSFAAKKGEKLVLEVQSASLGFPVDPWLKVESIKGDELAKNDDSGNADPKLEWTAPEDGVFAVAVGNLIHQS